MMGDALRVGTWNILGRRTANTLRAVPPGAVSSVIGSVGVDILCLQEVHFYGDSPDEQLVTELRSAGLEYFVGRPFSPSHLDESALLGVAVASTRPLTETHVVRLSNPGLTALVRGNQWVLHDKGMIGCRVDLPGAASLDVYSLHLFPFFEFGVSEDDQQVTEMWQEFWSCVDTLSESDRTILAGDFNQQQREAPAEKWSKRSWNFCLDSTSTVTNGLALDEVALDWRPTLYQLQVIPNFSDHHLAVVDLRL
jgi:endonuclease/exonuclease/phosphatase family metal-dependent hydrolase